MAPHSRIASSWAPAAFSEIGASRSAVRSFSRSIYARPAAWLASLGVKLPGVDAEVGLLSGGQRQSVAICRAVTWARRVVFMDEPTAALGVLQTRRVVDLIRRVRDSGVAVVLISHSMPQVLEVSDRIEVLRLGARVARFTTGEANAEDLVAAMTGLLTYGVSE